MGKNKIVFCKKIKLFSGLRVGVALAALVFVFLAPVLAMAGVTSTAWTDTECAKIGGAWLPTDASSQTFDCFAKEVPSPIMISIGSVSGTTTLTKYIAAFYNYMVAGAAVLAVIYIMIGGFQILYSAGGGEVGEGRKKITSAVLGLVLIFCSYVLLQTVNPALVSLQSPRLKLIKASYLDQLTPSNGIGKGSACWTESDAEACKAACDSCICKVLKEPPAAKIAIGIPIAMLSISAAVGGAAAGIAAAGAASGASIASATLNILRGGGRAIWAATKFEFTVGKALGGTAGGVGTVVGVPLAGTAYLASELWGSDKNSKGEKGVCWPFANHDIAKGEICQAGDNQGCISNYCLTIDESLGIGICAVFDGTVDSLCKTESDCKKIQASAKCVTTVSDAYKKCTDGAVGSPCGQDGDCASGYKCDTSRYVCGGGGGFGIGAVCTGSADCAGSNCAMPGGSTKGTCVTGTLGSYCYRDSDCNNATSGLVCLGYDLNTESRQGVCGTPTLDGECFSNHDCPTGSHCAIEDTGGVCVK